MKKVIVCVSVFIVALAVVISVYSYRKIEYDTKNTKVADPLGYTPRVVTYHLIRDDTFGGNEFLFVRPSEFEEQLRIFSEYDYEYLFADEWGITKRPSVIITFDDGYVDNYTEMYNILIKYSAKATVFLITDLIDTDGYLTSSQIKEMAESGYVEFQCHTSSHEHLTGLTSDELREDFTQSVEIIEELTGMPVTALAYPYGEYDENVINIASEFFTFAYTTENPSDVIEHAQFNIPRYYVVRGYDKDEFIKYIG